MQNYVNLFFPINQQIHSQRFIASRSVLVSQTLISHEMKKAKNQLFFALLMQKMGVEPTRYCYHTDLNRARLPIPPLLHTCGRWDLNPHDITATRSLV